jgi:hypothetical protein
MKISRRYANQTRTYANSYGERVIIYVGKSALFKPYDYYTC